MMRKNFPDGFLFCIMVFQYLRQLSGALRGSVSFQLHAYARIDFGDGVVGASVLNITMPFSVIVFEAIDTLL